MIPPARSRIWALPQCAQTKRSVSLPISSGAEQLAQDKLYIGKPPSRFSGAIQSQSCPYMPSQPAVFIASPMGSEPGSVALNAAGLTRLYAQPDLLQLLQLWGRAQTPAFSNNRRNTCMGRNLTFRRFSSRRNRRSRSMKLILGFIFFRAAMDETRQSTGERSSSCNTVSAMLRSSRLSLGPMARAIGHAARPAAAAGCGGGWWSG